MNASLRRKRGFSLIELLVVLAIFGIAALIGMPALIDYLQRQKLVGSAREAATLMRLARMEAIKRGVRAGVTVDYETSRFIVFVDSNGNLALDDNEQIGMSQLPNGVSLWGPGDLDDGGANASSGFPEVGFEGVGLFNSDGSLVVADPDRPYGAFRLKGEADNYLEVRVQPAMTGRVQVQRWFGGPAEDPENWFENGEEGNDWEWDEEPDGEPCDPCPP